MTIWKCSKCWETCLDYPDDWLIADVPSSTFGEMVIRCPKCITKYAIKKAGGQVVGSIGIVGHKTYSIPNHKEK